jgi:hypothetical protein
MAHALERQFTKVIKREQTPLWMCTWRVARVTSTEVRCTSATDSYDRVHVAHARGT